MASFFSKLTRSSSSASSSSAAATAAATPAASGSESRAVPVAEDQVHEEQVSAFAKAITEFAYDKAKDSMVR